MGLPRFPRHLASATLCLFIAFSVSKAGHLPYRIFGLSDGLPSVAINKIYLDSKGLLWFCTEEGLSVFDGQRFKNFGPDQGLPDRSATDMFETSDGQYWISTMRGLALFNPNGFVSAKHPNLFELYAPPEGGPAIQIVALAPAKNNQVWCSTHDGLYRFDLSTKRYERILGVIGGDWWTAMLVDPDGSLWLGSQSLFHLGPTGRLDRFGQAEGFASALVRVSDILRTRDGRLWVATWNGLYLMAHDPVQGGKAVERRFAERDGLPNSTIFSLFETSQGRLLVGVSRGGVSEFVPSTDTTPARFRNFVGSDSLSIPDFGEPSIDSIGEDAGANIWVSAGIRIDIHGFETFTKRDGLRTVDIGSIFEDKQGQLVVLTCDPRCRYISTLHGTEFDTVEIRLPKELDRVTWGFNQIHFQDRQGDWWVATTRGLCRYTNSRPLSYVMSHHPDRVYSKREGLTGDEIFRLFEDSAGDVWISMLGKNTVSVWHRKTDRIVTYTHDINGRPLDVPTGFVQDPSGNMWVSLFSGNVARFGSERCQIFTQQEGLPNSAIRTLFVDHAGRLWLGTSRAGLYFTQTPEAQNPIFEIAKPAVPFSSTEIKSITEDLNHRLYVVTGRSIDRFDPLTGAVQRFTSEDGLGVSATPRVSFRDRHGVLWFGGTGLLRYMPTREPNQLPAVTVRITQLRVHGSEFPVSELAQRSIALPRLSSDETDLHIEFTAWNFKIGRKLDYLYRLVGSKSALWNSTRASGVDLAALRPGDYRFEVKAVDLGSGQRDEALGDVATISFSILAPVWQRPWFLLGMLFTACALALALHWARLSHVQAINRVRDAIGSELHDDAGTTLAQISMFSEIARRKIFASPHHAEALLLQIGEQSRELTNTIAQIIWAWNSNYDRLGDLLSYMRRFASEILEPCCINSEFTVRHTRLKDLRFEVEQKRHLFLIFKELITNIAKHSRCKTAIIRIVIDEDIDMSVEDDGQGFDGSQKSLGNGIRNVSRRAELLGGTLVIESSALSGTKARLRVPLQRGRFRHYLNR